MTDKIPHLLYLCHVGEAGEDSVIVLNFDDAKSFGYQWIDLFVEGEHAQTFKRVVDSDEYETY